MSPVLPSQARPPFAPSGSKRPFYAASALALAVGLASAQAQPAPATAPAPAAQPAAAAADDEAIQLGEFVVSEVRASLMQAQEVKQNSFQFVDAIVAQDVGKFPDNSVADALQRIPGVQVTRGSEVGLVLIRGLPNIATTLNNNEIFTGTGRGVALQDIPAELVSSVEVFKTSSPEHVEGGIAGLININLRRPLEFKGLKVAGTARAIHAEKAEKTGYVGSILASNRWKLASGGDFGALYSYSYQKQHFLDQTIFNYLFEPVPTTLVPGQTDVLLPFTQGSLLTPDERERSAHNISLQWRPSSELEVYSDFLYTAYRDERQVHFLIGFPRFGDLQSVTVQPGTNIPLSTRSLNNFHLTSMQAFRDRTDGYQAVLGAKWQRDRLKAGTEFIYNWSFVKHNAVIVDTRFGPPTPGTFVFNYNNGGQADLRITGADVTNPENYYLWGLFDNRDYARSDQRAWKADVEYALGDGFLRSIKGGVRLADRSVKFRASNRNDIAPAGAVGGDRFHANVPKVSTIPGFSSVSPDGIFDNYGTPHWLGANPDFLYNNTGRVRQLFGLATSDPDFAPTLAFTDEEKTYSAYVQANYSIDLAGRALEGTAGVRVVQTKQTLVGYAVDGRPLFGDEDQVDALPSLTGRYRLRPDVLLRFSAGRTLTRANFNDLNPATTLNAPTTTGGAAGGGSGGNPDLKTVKSDNFDLGVEYYFAKASYLGAAAFYRLIDGYVQPYSQPETYSGITYNVTRPRNAGEGELKGFEFTYQHFPEFLPDFLKGLGWHTNFTYMDGETDAPHPNPARVGVLVRQPYTQVPRTAYNIIAIYERAKFSFRAAYNWRGDYTDTFTGPNSPDPAAPTAYLIPLRQIKAKSRDFLDLSASYALTDRLKLSFEIQNALESEYQDYFSDPRYPRDTRGNDRTFALGLRYNY